jgi:hypothetical protein
MRQLILPAAVLLAGILIAGAFAIGGRYQAVSATHAAIYVVDRLTGSVRLYTPQGYRQINEPLDFSASSSPVVQPPAR